MHNILIIAEAGVNHNGDITLAEKLIDAAAQAGADVVKFQTFTADKIVTKTAAMADYQIKNTENSDSQYEMLKKLELSADDHVRLINYCKMKKIQFCSTAFDSESIDFLKTLSLPFWKIPSGEITNLPYLRKIGSFNESIILSTGMSYLYEVGQALDILQKAGTSLDKITVLHCNTDYPTHFGDVNLKAMLTVQDAFKVKIGYSDHTPGIEVPIAAAAMGASVIEKHFTLDKNLPGPDHQASLEPDELRAMIRSIRNIEKALGDGVKRPSGSEYKNISVARKSLVAAREIKAGEVFTENNLTVKRPGTGITPLLWDTFIGRKADKSYGEDELI
jgi:N,N'-diacetyllegionaminate synthase